MDYTIKDMCQKLDLSVHTVRHYCDMGLVPNLRHDKYGNRIFDDHPLTGCRAPNFYGPAECLFRKSGIILSCARKESLLFRSGRKFSSGCGIRLWQS